MADSLKVGKGPVAADFRGDPPAKPEFIEREIMTENAISLRMELLGGYLATAVLKLCTAAEFCVMSLTVGETDSEPT